MKVSSITASVVSYADMDFREGRKCKVPPTKFAHSLGGACSSVQIGPGLLVEDAYHVRMKTLRVVVGVLIIQTLLVGAYLAVYRQDPIIPDPDRGHMVQNGVTMVMFCGAGSYRAALDKVPPNGDLGMWTRGRTVRGDCDIWYHRGALYHKDLD